MVSPRTLALSTILCLYALPAGAQGPTPRRAALDPAASSPTPASRVAMPDLTCEITAYTDDGVPVANPVPIPNGAQLTYAPGTKTYVKVALKRSPAQAGGAYDAAISVRLNGAEVIPAAYGSIHVAAGIGQHVISPAALLTYEAPSNRVLVGVRTDTGGAVAESNEGNNACRMAFGVQVQ